MLFKSGQTENKFVQKPGAGQIEIKITHLSRKTAPFSQKLGKAGSGA
jgi:hypothetical protein